LVNLEAALRDFNRGMIAVIDLWDESDDSPGDETSTDDWIRDFTLPLE
jgi:hypothetical protein